MCLDAIHSQPCTKYCSFQQLPDISPEEPLAVRGKAEEWPSKPRQNSTSVSLWHTVLSRLMAYVATCTIDTFTGYLNNSGLTPFCFSSLKQIIWWLTILMVTVVCIVLRSLNKHCDLAKPRGNTSFFYYYIYYIKYSSVMRVNKFVSVFDSGLAELSCSYYEFIGVCCCCDIYSIDSS